MDWLKNRRAVLFGGMALALIAGLIIAAIIVSSSPPHDEPPPASEGGLVVQTGRDDDVKLDPKRPLRCFVKGQFVGELPLGDCAKQNGVATGALDVGLDPSGALAAAKNGAASLTPLTPAASPSPAAGDGDASADLDPAATAVDDKLPPASGRKTEACWRYVDARWERVPGDLELAACVRAVYAGHCAGAGAVQFGRWGERGLRAVAGRVELTSEDGDYRPLTTLSSSCAPAPFG